MSASDEVRLKASAQREMDDLTGVSYARVSGRLLALEQNPRPPGCRKLHGRQGYRLRVGDYRVLSEVDDRAREVQVFAVRHRRDAYR